METSTPRASTARVTWLSVTAIATALALLETVKGYWAVRLQGGHRSLLDALINNAPWWYVWAAFTPIIVWIASRARLDQASTRYIAAPIHLLAALVLGVIHIAIVGTLFFHTAQPLPNVPNLQTLLVRWLITFIMVQILTYGGIVGIYYAIDYARRYRESAIARAQLEQRMAEARLHALQMELNPHFLFNTLNTITGLVREQRTAPAIDMIVRLSDLLRATLERSHEPETTLGEELRLLQLYLDVERCRFGSRLQVEVNVAPGLEQARLPTFCLQPLVENAIRHGVARHPGAGNVSIAASVADDKLVIRVENSGPVDASTNVELRAGVGLSNTQARLAQLYGSAAGFRLAALSAGGAVATVTIPLHA